MTAREQQPKHDCPGPECKQQVAQDKLACRRHWYQVSAETRSWVLTAWAGGLGEGTQSHRAAIIQAMSEMRP